MDKETIVEKLKPIVEKPNNCGFEAYLLSRSAPQLKKMNLSRDLSKTLKKKLIDLIQDNYLSEDSIFADGLDVGDNQNKYYIIEQDSEYNPFDLKNWTIQSFDEKHIDDFMGILFMLRYEQQEIWCYQNKRAITVSNRKNMNILASFKKYENGIIFEEQNSKIMSFSSAIDILIINGFIITKEIGLLERSFAFQTFIHKKAQNAAESIASTNLFSGMDKLKEYLASEAKSHNKYRKRMMKALDSPVLHMNSEQLYEKLSTLARWKDKFKRPVDGVIPIESNNEIESLIDLFAERFTRSDVTGEEYDTEVKKRVT